MFQHFDEIKKINTLNYILQTAIGDTLKITVDDLKIDEKSKENSHILQTNTNTFKDKIRIDKHLDMDKINLNPFLALPITKQEELPVIVEDPAIMVLSWPDESHLYLKVRALKSGDYEVRLRKFKKHDDFEIKDLIEEYELINFYYNRLNKYYQQKCPSFYDYRCVNLSIRDYHIIT